MPQVVNVESDEVLTGEAIALDVQPVGVLMRALGALIDYGILVIVYLTWALLVFRLVLSGVLSENAFQIMQITALVVIFVIVPITVESLTHGRSLGKLAIGGRIVRADGGAIGFRQSMIRGLMAVLEIIMTLGGLAFIVAIFTPRAQRLGDLAAGTYCERTRTPKILETGIAMPPQLYVWSQTADVSRLPVRLNRRITQFLTNASNISPVSRMRLAAELVAEATPFVSPVPPTDPETFLLGIVAMRRDREYAALQLQNSQTATLTAGL